MSKLSISLEWFLQEDELKPDSFSKNHENDWLLNW